VGNNRQTPPVVDVSPLAQLTEEQVAHIENVWSHFEASEFTYNFRMSDLPDNRERSHSYRFNWQNERLASMHITVSVFRDEETPINSFQQRMGLMDRRGRERYVYITNDNNTEAILWYVFTDMPYLVPTFDREIWTDIRIGNVRIRSRETRRVGTLRNNSSSQFVTLLVEMLQNADGTPD